MKPGRAIPSQRAGEHRFMRRLARSATTIAAASIALLPPAWVTPQAAEQQRPTFPAQAELVTVDVVVTDKSGAPVVGLRREDFSVTEDGTAGDRELRRGPQARGRRKRDRPRDELRPSTNLRDQAETASFVIVFDELHLAPVEASGLARRSLHSSESGRRPRPCGDRGHGGGHALDGAHAGGTRALVAGAGAPAGQAGRRIRA